MGLYILLNLVLYLSSSSIRPFITFSLILISFASLIFARSVNFKIKPNYPVIIFLSILCFLLLFIQPFSSNLHYHPIFIFPATAFAYFILHSRFNTKILYSSILILFIFFSFQILSGQDPNKIFPELSRNYISIILIANVSILYIIEWKQSRRILLWPAVVTLIISVVSIGRAGILSSSFLLAALLFVKYENFSVTKKILYAFIFILPFVCLTIFYSDFLIEKFYQIDYLKRITSMGLKDNARLLMINEYLENMNVKNLIFGYDYSSDPLFLRYKLNPHNSFIEFHHKTGIFFFPAILTLFMAGIKNLFSKNKMYSILLFVLLLRAFTDRFLFLSIYDYIFVLIILLSFRRPNIKIMQNQSLTYKP